MKGIEPIIHNTLEVACVYRSSLVVKNNIQFLTSQDNPFQIGIHDRKEKIRLPTHLHNCPKPIEISEIQELLYVISGQIRVYMYTKDNKKIAQKLLSPGDAILLKSAAHSVEFLGNARVFEVKQGPYPGYAHAKIFFDKT